MKKIFALFSLLLIITPSFFVWGQTSTTTPTTTSTPTQKTTTDNKTPTPTPSNETSEMPGIHLTPECLL